MDSLYKLKNANAHLLHLSDFTHDMTKNERLEIQIVLKPLNI